MALLTVLNQNRPNARFEEFDLLCRWRGILIRRCTTSAEEEEQWQAIKRSSAVGPKSQIVMPNRAEHPGQHSRLDQGKFMLFACGNFGQLRTLLLAYCLFRSRRGIVLGLFVLSF